MARALVPALEFLHFGEAWYYKSFNSSLPATILVGQAVPPAAAFEAACRNRQLGCGYAASAVQAVSVSPAVAHALVRAAPVLVPALGF